MITREFLDAFRDSLGDVIEFVGGETEGLMCFTKEMYHGTVVYLRIEKEDEIKSIPVLLFPKPRAYAEEE